MKTTPGAQAPTTGSGTYRCTACSVRSDELTTFATRSAPCPKRTANLGHRWAALKPKHEEAPLTNECMGHHGPDLAGSCALCGNFRDPLADHLQIGQPIRFIAGGTIYDGVLCQSQGSIRVKVTGKVIAATFDIIRPQIITGNAPTAEQIERFS